MKKLLNRLVAIFSIFSLLLGFSSAQARVDGDTITLGAAVSLTGKYSTNGEHTKNGYN